MGPTVTTADSAVLPTGTVTFLFTDIEGSTLLVARLGDVYVGVLTDHDAIVNGAVTAHGGTTFGNEGDSWFAVFVTAGDAVAAAVDVQRGLAGHEFAADAEVRVRIGLHTGQAVLGGRNYVGLDLHRAARIGAAGHGGQTLLSEPTAALVDRALPQGVELRDLGKHRLKDLAEPEALFEITVAGLLDEFAPLRTLDAVPNNLPLQVTTFVGRERELGQAIELLGRSHVLTLTGPGGTGKSRLSLQVAAEVADEYPDGVFFVGLSPITDPELVPSAILEALGLASARKDVTPMDRLAEHLAQHRVLLVLDNFEQLIPAAPVVADLVRASPRSRFLISSRSPLRIAGEQEMPVPPLSVPSDGHGEVSALLRVDAIHLFVERAMAVRPDFMLSAENSSAVVALVDRLDGLPLAIEIVASRVRLLPPAAILERFDVTMGSGVRGLPERQQTLAGAIDWSYDLLDGPCRLLFDRLSVFPGGARLEEIETVCGPGLGIAVLDGLEALVDQSLVRQVDASSGVRFRMLHVIREYAASKLSEHPDAAEIERRHAAAYLSLAEEARPHLTGVDRAAWLDVLGADHDNLRAAIAWGVAHGATDDTRRLVAAMWRFWQARGHLHEARRRVTVALEMPDGDVAVRASAVEALGGIAWWQGDMEVAPAAYEEALAIQRSLGDPGETANALYNFALAQVFGAEETESAFDMLEEAAALYEQLDDPGGLANVYWARGNVLSLIVGREEEGLEYFAASVPLYARAGNEFGLGWAYFELGFVGSRVGDLDEAAAHLRKGLELFAAHDDVSGIVFHVMALAGIAKDQGDMDRAVRLAGAAHALRITSGADLINIDINQPTGLEYETLEAMTGPLAAAYQEGKALDVADAVAYALDAAGRTGSQNAS